MKKETRSISYTFRIKPSVFEKLKELDTDGTGLNNVLEEMIRIEYSEYLTRIVHYMMGKEDD